MNNNREKNNYTIFYSTLILFKYIILYCGYTSNIR